MATPPTSQPGQSSGVRVAYNGPQAVDTDLFDLLVNDLAQGPRLRQLFEKNNLVVVVNDERNEPVNTLTVSLQDRVMEMEEKLESMLKETDALKTERETNELIWSGLMDENNALKEQLRNAEELTTELNLVRGELATEKERNEEILKEKEKACWKSKEEQLNLKNELTCAREQLREKERNFEEKMKEEVAKIQSRFEDDRNKRTNEIIALKNEKERMETEALRFKLFLKKLGNACGFPEERGADVLASSEQLEALITDVENMLREQSQERNELERSKETILYLKGLFELGCNYLSATSSTTPIASQPTNEMGTSEPNTSTSSSSGSTTNVTSAGSRVFKAILAGLAPAPSTSTMKNTPEVVATAKSGDCGELQANESTNSQDERPSSPPIAVIHTISSLALLPNLKTSPPSSQSSFPPTPPPEDGILVTDEKSESEVMLATTVSSDSPIPASYYQLPDEIDVNNKVKMEIEIPTDQYPPPTISQEQSTSIPTTGSLSQKSTESTTAARSEPHTENEPSKTNDGPTGSNPTANSDDITTGRESHTASEPQSEPPRKRQRTSSVSKSKCRVPKQLTPFAVTDKRHGVNKESSRHRCLCGYGYSTEKDLKAHVRKMTMEWRYKCQSCQFYFFHVVDLNKHNC